MNTTSSKSMEKAKKLVENLSCPDYGITRMISVIEAERAISSLIELTYKEAYERGIQDMEKVQEAIKNISRSPNSKKPTYFGWKCECREEWMPLKLESNSFPDKFCGTCSKWMKRIFK